MGCWSDAAPVLARARGREPGATCFVRRTSEGNRIDVMFCNNVAMAAGRAVGIVADAGIPIRLAIGCHLDVAEYKSCHL